MPNRLYPLLLLCSGLLASLDLLAQERSVHLDPLIKALQLPGKDRSVVQERRDAALALSQLGAEAGPAVDALAAALDDPDTQVWFHSVTALARIGSAATPAIPTLIEDLTGQGRRGENAKWYRSAYALGNMGPAAIPPLQAALKDENASIRSGVAKAFGWIGEEGAVAIPALLQCLRDEDERVRQHSAESLGRMGPSALEGLSETLEGDHHPALLAALLALETAGPLALALADQLIPIARTHQAPDLQAAALRTLRATGLDPETLSSLAWSLSDHTDDAVKHEVANCLLDLPSELTVAPLRERLDTDDLATQLWAADLLGRMGTPALEAVPQLIVLVDGYGSQPQAKPFRKAIASLGPSAAEALFTHLAETSTSKPLDASHWIVPSLGNYGIPGLPKLAQGLTHDHINVRLASLYAIQRLGADGRNADRTIERLLDDPHPSIRAASLLSLVAISGDPSKYTDHIRRLLQDAEPIARHAAAKAIPAIDLSDRATIERLGELLEDSDHRIRLASTQAIASIGEPARSQSNRLTALIQDPSEEIQIATLKALGALGSASKSTGIQIADRATTSEGALQLAAIRCLGELDQDQPRIIEVLRTATAHEEPVIREAALDAFGRVSRDSEAIFDLSLEALKDSNSDIQNVAAKNLGMLEEDAIPATSALMALLGKEDYVPNILQALRKIPADPSQYPHYQNGLDSRSSGVRAYSAERLGQLGSQAEATVPRLKELAQRDRSRYVKARARSAVERITGEDFED